MMDTEDQVIDETAVDQADGATTEGDDGSEPGTQDDSAEEGE